MRILYTTTVGMTMNFFRHLIKGLIEDGHTVDIACNENPHKVSEYYRSLGCNIYQIDWSRSPFSKNNILAVKQLKQVLAANRYDIVHCHTPVAGICTRLACRKERKNGVRIFYTAHGFHFYKGAPLLNWLLYYPAERFCSRFTDTLITINKEDYALARRKMKAQRIAYVPGVGVDIDRFRSTVVDRAAKRAELGIPEDAFLLLSVGELNANKNHEAVIRALASLQDSSIHYMIAGEGPLRQQLQQLAETLQVGPQVHLLGYRSDVAELYKTADLYILPSKREGLNVSLIEASAGGVPCIASRIRGNTDILENDDQRMFRLQSSDDLCYKIKIIKNQDTPSHKNSNENKKEYSYEQVEDQIKKMYMNIKE